MKKVLFICLLTVGVLSCKKEKDEPEPEPVPPTYLISVKVDGAVKQCNSCYSGSKSGNSRSSYFYLDGFNEQIYFDLNDLSAIGTHTLVKYGDPLLIYIKNNTYYRATNGTINIASIDTSAKGVVNKLQATFSFQTDTSNNQFFNITEGTINLK